MRREYRDRSYDLGKIVCLGGLTDLSRSVSISVSEMAEGTLKCIIDVLNSFL